MSRSRLGLEAERLGSRLGLGHEGLVSIPGVWRRTVGCHKHNKSSADEKSCFDILKHTDMNDDVEEIKPSRHRSL